jgi:hypothetical protein
LGLQNESLINQKIKQIKEKKNRSIQKLFRIPKKLKTNLKLKSPISILDKLKEKFVLQIFNFQFLRIKKKKS